MKQKLLTKLLLMLLCLVGGAFSAWADTSTLTFSAKCNGSGTADDGASWTVTSDGTESNFDSKGIHYGTSNAQVTYIQLSTSDISGTITKVVVNASTASGVTATVSVTVGGAAFGGEAKSLTSSAANYTFNGSASGEIIVRVEKPSKAAKALYVKSIAVTYESSIPITSISGMASSASIEVGGTTTLTPTVLPANTTETVTWESDDTDVATVSAGVVTGVAAGTATITAKSPSDATIKAECTVTVNAPTKVATPTMSVAEGTYNAAQSVEINCGTDDATIYYTTDGTDPTTSSSVYSSAISVTQTTTIKAFAVKDGLTKSDIASATYTLKCVAPTFDPAAGSVGYGTEIALSTTTEGATIYYTTNGDIPTSSSSTYDSSNKPNVSGNQTFKAIATKTGWSDSDVSSATYTYYYVITAKSNNDEYGTVSGTTTITATPEDGYRVVAGDGGYTVTKGTAAVTNNGDNTFTVTPTSNCTVQINFEAIPTHTVTFFVNGDVSRTATVAEGAAITFPTAVETTPGEGEFSKEINGQTFQGWYTAAYSNASVAPSYINTASTNMGTSDVTYYAVFADYVAAVHDYVTDELDYTLIGVSGTTYTAWSNKSDESDAKYAGQSAGGNTSIQLRHTSPSGIITTASGGVLTSVTIDWNTNTTNARYVTIYGNNTAYTGASQLYNNATYGTTLGTIAKGTSTELEVSGSYTYMGILARDPLYINKISITWDKGTPASCSNYTTDNRAAAGIAYANGEVDVKQTSGYTGQALTNPNSLTVAYSSSDETVATVNASTGAITELLKAGTTTITATFAGNATYKPAEVSYDLNVTEKTPHGLAYATAEVEKLTTDAAFTNTLTNGNSLTVSYSSSATGVATVNSSTGEVTIKGAGSTTITATFAGDDDYEEGSASYTLTVSKATPTLSFASASATLREGEAFAGNALTNPASLTVSYTSSATSVAMVNSSTGVPTFVAAGSTTITASFAGNDTYTSGSASYTLTVLAAPTIDVRNQTIAWGETFTVDDSKITGGGITVTSGNTSIATVDGLEITPVACGEVEITVSTAENGTYKEGSATFTLTIEQPDGGTTAREDGEILLFGESFGNNTGSARDWSDSYSVKSGVSSVYSGITGYTVSNVKQGKNTTGSPLSGLNQSTENTDAYIIMGPLDVADYSALTLKYQWKAGSTKGTYSTHLYYATSSSGDYTEVSGTGAGATSFVERSYSLPAAAQVSTLYLKIVWNTSNTQAIIDEVQLKGSLPGTESVTLNASGYATFCSQYPLDFTGYATNGFSAWQITNIDEDSGDYTITFSEIKTTIKGGQGILLKGEASTTINIPSSNSTTELDGNLLEGTIAPQYVSEDTYYGLKGDNFVPVNAGTVKAGKALLPASALSSGSPVKGFTFVFEDEEDGIKTLSNSPLKGENIYNLAGQRISKMQKGINIVNGRKVLF